MECRHTTMPGLQRHHSKPRKLAHKSCNSTASLVDLVKMLLKFRLGLMPVPLGWDIESQHWSKAKSTYYYILSYFPSG